MNLDIVLSLCIPTNGVVEWVIPVLDSIFEEKNPLGIFEVIVTDNGDNVEFEKKIKEYTSVHNNLIYKKTKAIQFYNQIEAFKLARGKMIKFVNHRMKFLPGSLNYLISFVQNNVNEKPVVYFSNGFLQDSYFDNFNEYVNGLSYWSSWSAGTTMWKEDFDKLDLTKTFNKLFPHIDMIFSDKEKNGYLIDNHVLMNEIYVDDTKKGKYDLFNAFAVEYLAIILKLYRDGEITIQTFYNIKKQIIKFVADLYFQYVILKKPCSYDLSGYRNSINIFINHKEILKQIPNLICKKILNCVKNNFRK